MGTLFFGGSKSEEYFSKLLKNSRLVYKKIKSKKNQKIILVATKQNSNFLDTKVIIFLFLSKQKLK